VCHGPAGSCQRTDDSLDGANSLFEVADRTQVDLYCCASTTGYKMIDMKMTSIEHTRDAVQIKRREQLDGSTVICANQQSLFRQVSKRYLPTLKCELIVDNRSYSTLTSTIVVKGNS
jgi:hypothetical protein